MPTPTSKQPSSKKTAGLGIHRFLLPTGFPSPMELFRANGRESSGFRPAPVGAQECSHGWSDAAWSVAQPVEGCMMFDSLRRSEGISRG